MFKLGMVGSEEFNEGVPFWTPKQKSMCNKVISFIFDSASFKKRIPIPPYGNIRLSTISSIEFRKYDGDLIYVSGGCKYGGPDIWGEKEAKLRQVVPQILYPKVNSWEDKDGKIGFKSRNMQIAEAIPDPPDGILIDFEPEWRSDHGLDRKMIIKDNNETTLPFRRSGGTWTYQYAKKIGKEAYVVVI